MSTTIDFADIQGLVRFGYKHMPKARYILLRVKDAPSAREWLSRAPVANAVYKDSPPKTALHVAFTAPGLKALGLSQEIVAEFSHEFRDGMPAEHRARQLGDIATNAPGNWDWGASGSEPHVLALFFGKPDSFENFVSETKGPGWSRGFEEVRTLDTADLDGVEPFGFADGISEPEIDWEQKVKRPTIQYTYTNVTSLGEFLLGYRNEYGKFTERPLLEETSATRDLYPAEESPGKRDLGRNGTYLVMRQLDQDVRSFWSFLHKNSGGDFKETEKLAAAMVGRKRNGRPLVPTDADASPGQGTADNAFTFDRDEEGARCPFGAHVRRANPRNADFPQPPPGFFKKLITALGFATPNFRDDLMSSVRFHRILRRGREYGSELKPEDALGPPPPDEAPRGLHFICLNANIGRQFEFIQNAWMASTKFSALTGESDPLLGNRQAIPGCPYTADFTEQKAGGLRRRITGLPQFVTVRGGAYFFLPSIRALRYIARQEPA